MLKNLIFISISLLIGLLIGLERERSHKEGIKAIGIRTFILFCLLGTAASIINQPILIFTSSIFVLGIIILSYFRATMPSRQNVNIGITTETSAFLIYCIGFIIPTSPLFAITLSALISLVLVERKRLHTLARQKLNPQEIESAIILIIFSIGIIPILPNEPIDPWGLFNPKNFGILVATIAGLQFAGYVSIRLFGEFFGIALTGFLGGLISSTAMFASLSNLVKKYPKHNLTIIASGLLSTVAMIIEVSIIIFVASSDLFFSISKPLIGMLISGITLSLFLLRQEKTKSSHVHTLSNPLHPGAIIRISFLIGFMLILIAIFKHYIGIKGMLLISFLSGLFEIHSISLATALLYLQDQIKLHNASLLIYVALLATFISKFFLLWTTTPYRFALYTSLSLLGILLPGILIYWVII